MSALFRPIRTIGSLVKFSHTVFALPFALSMFVVASREQPVSLGQLWWILVCLVSARTAAMAFNRVFDADIDAKNPRTSSREIPAGVISRFSVGALVILFSVLFLYGAWKLGVHCFLLAPFVLGILLLYSCTKRFTSWSHVVLGLCLAMAPGGVWYAITGVVSIVPIVLMAAVLFWVAGFDILYSCQDSEFDRTEGLFSLPAYLGIEKSLLLSRAFHGIAVILLAVFGGVAELGWIYMTGVVVFSALLVNQHCLVSPGDMTRVNAAFFTRNGIASVALFGFVLLDVLL